MRATAKSWVDASSLDVGYRSTTSYKCQGRGADKPVFSRTSQHVYIIAGGRGTSTHCCTSPQACLLCDRSKIQKYPPPYMLKVMHRPFHTGRVTFHRIKRGDGVCGTVKRARLCMKDQLLIRQELLVYRYNQGTIVIPMQDVEWWV